MTTIILTVRPEPDCHLDVAALARRGAPAMAAPLMTPVYACASPLADADSYGGVIFTSRHAVTGMEQAGGGEIDPSWHGLPVFAVGRSTGRAAAAAGFGDITIGSGGGAGLVPLITGRAGGLQGPLLWPAAAERSYDMAAALASQVAVQMKIVYRMEPLRSLPRPAMAAVEKGDVLAVILMSARSARLFRETLEASGRDAAPRQMAVIAGSQAIADAAGGGWRRVYVARRPSRARLLAIAALLYDRRDSLA